MEDEAGRHVWLNAYAAIEALCSSLAHLNTVLIQTAEGRGGMSVRTHPPHMAPAVLLGTEYSRSSQLTSNHRPMFNSNIVCATSRYERGLNTTPEARKQDTRLLSTAHQGRTLDMVCAKGTWRRTRRIEAGKGNVRWKARR